MGEIELGMSGVFQRFQRGLQLTLVFSVFITPENATSPEWIKFFRSKDFLARTLGIAFDEAHTIHQWYYDFLGFL
jgi:superfamily II DNA helicase RecQ